MAYCGKFRDPRMCILRAARAGVQDRPLISPTHLVARHFPPSRHAEPLSLSKRDKCAFAIFQPHRLARVQTQLLLTLYVLLQTLRTVLQIGIGDSLPKPVKVNRVH